MPASYAWPAIKLSTAADESRIPCCIVFRCSEMQWSGDNIVNRGIAVTPRIRHPSTTLPGVCRKVVRTQTKL